MRWAFLLIGKLANWQVGKLVNWWIGELANWCPDSYRDALPRSLSEALYFWGKLVIAKPREVYWWIGFPIAKARLLKESIWKNEANIDLMIYYISHHSHFRIIRTFAFRVIRTFALSHFRISCWFAFRVVSSRHFGIVSFALSHFVLIRISRS